MVGSGRAGSPIVFFYKDQTSEPLRGKKHNLLKRQFVRETFSGSATRETIFYCIFCHEVRRHLNLYFQYYCVEYTRDPRSSHSGDQRPRPSVKYLLHCAWISQKLRHLVGEQNDRQNWEESGLKIRGHGGLCEQKKMHFGNGIRLPVYFAKNS